MDKPYQERHQDWKVLAQLVMGGCSLHEAQRRSVDMVRLVEGCMAQTSG